ncbi:MAG: C40 family peptidase [Parachlamydiales bacterium]|jgi:hypothetical protein
MSAHLFFLPPVFHYINVPMAEMRQDAQLKSAVVSSARAFEEVRILQEEGDWRRIETLSDHYCGWVKKEVLCQTSEAYLKTARLTAKVSRLAAFLYEQPEIVFGPALRLPFEVLLEVVEPLERSSPSRFLKVRLPDCREFYAQRGDLELEPAFLSQEAMAAISLRFLDLPYLWGGRTSFGYDCSGFTQMLYRQMGLFIPRDAKDQILWEGFEPIAFADLKPGNLIFWGTAETCICHVGLYLGEGRFIHTSPSENRPWVRLSHLSDESWNCSGVYKYRQAVALKPQ